MSAVCAPPASIRSLSYSHLRRTRFGIALRTLTSRTSALFLRYCTLPIPLSFVRSGLARCLLAPTSWAYDCLVLSLGGATMSSQSRSSRRSTVDKSVLKWTTFLYLSSLLPSYATELPTDIWNGGHGGFPSVTANHSGVSITLPQQAIIDAGGGPLDKLVKGFLDRWAPEMCSDLFDFQHSHERMALSVAVYTGSFNPGTYQELIIDYRPSHEVNCVQPDILVW